MPKRSPPPKPDPKSGHKVTKYASKAKGMKPGKKGC
jgi:hypothetical protein